ncbi:MAG: L-fucose:H+ symporter permease [Rikenellaceae bacterium]
MNQTSSKVVERRYLLPFIIITSLFALWGFANDITNPMVAAFKTVMEISTAKASLIQFAFYGGYATMAIPAALFVQRFSYKKGILLGLALYATGALLFFPAAHFQQFEMFLVSLYILTFGLAFLETTANPYILSMGSAETSTRRLNLAQSFNPIGSLLGMFVASRLILARLQCDAQTDAAGGKVHFSTLPDTIKDQIRLEDLAIIRNPYVILGLFVLVMFVIILCTKMPNTTEDSKVSFKESLSALLKNKLYCGGVIAQVFYVGAQIMCWTFIIQYAGRLGIAKADAQMYNIAAMGMFLAGRFIATSLMKFVNSRLLLFFFALGAIITILGAIFIDGMGGLYCLMATSIFMSLMFPTIYGIALEKVGKHATLGAAGLVMAIVGGSVMPPLQGAIIDLKQIGSMSAVNISFILPLICFIIIMRYAFLAYKSR